MAAPDTSLLHLNGTMKSEVTDQLRRVLSSPWFRSSNRSCLLLRHIVEVTLYGEVEHLKERVIAVEIFHRKTSYDNNTDPVVRIVAGEVRKRLSQYYGVAENADQIRIELPIGTYVPQFHFPEPINESQESKAAPAEFGRTLLSTSKPPKSTLWESKRLPGDRIDRKWVWISVCLLILIVAGSRLVHKTSQTPEQAEFDAFWAPIVSSSAPPLISVGELRANSLASIPNSQRFQLFSDLKIQSDKLSPDGISAEPIAYSQASAKIAAVIGSKNVTFDVREQSATTFGEFVKRPSVLIGSFDNDWVIGTCNGKRFEYKYDAAQKKLFISDKEKPGQKIGALDISIPAPDQYDAYSIVLREIGPMSGQTRLVVSGIGEKGTLAAAEFVSNPKYLNELAKKLPKGWTAKNIEFLIRTRVFENTLGVPTLVDYTSW